MARTKTIETKGKLITGFVALGLHGGEIGTPRQAAVDGDTVNVHAGLNFGVRFLNIDTPESRLPLPFLDGEIADPDAPPRFVSIDDERWIDFLNDPFAAKWQEFDPALEPELIEHLQRGMGEGCAENHHKHAKAAEETLTEEIEADLAALGQTKETFHFFLAFAHEIMDRNGRFLCWINRWEPGTDHDDYNERQLARGMATPYFIWPNLDPFRDAPTLTDAVLAPHKALETAETTEKLAKARASVQQARDDERGIFDAVNPLRLHAFELRFLGRRQPPERWVIDLSKEDDMLVQPQRYHTIPRVEDRLFVNEEHVPLFAEQGWRLQP